MPWIMAVDGGNRMPSLPRCNSSEIGGKQFEQRQQRERCERKIVAMQAEKRKAQQRTHRAGNERSDQKGQHNRHTVDVRKSERVGANPEIDVVSEIYIAGFAVQPIPALSDDVGVEQGEKEGRKIGAPKHRHE